MDEIQEAPGSIMEIAAALDLSQRMTRHYCLKLEAEGLIEPLMYVRHTNGTNVAIYRMTHTKKPSSITELGPVAA